MSRYELYYRIPRPTGKEPAYELPYPHAISSDVEGFDSADDTDAREHVEKFLATKPWLEFNGVVYPAKEIKLREVRDVPRSKSNSSDNKPA